MASPKLCSHVFDSATPCRAPSSLEPSCLFLITMQIVLPPEIQTLKWPTDPQLTIPSLLFSFFPHQSFVLTLHTHPFAFCQAFSALTNPAQSDARTVFPDLLPSWCFLIVSAYMVSWLLCFRDEKSDDNSRQMEGNPRFWYITQEIYLRERLSIQHISVYPQKGLFFWGTDSKAHWWSLVW